MVTTSVSLMVAGIWPVTEPSLKAVSERTTPLVWSTMRIVEAGGKEPAGAVTETLPLWSGMPKTSALGLKVGGVLACVVKETVGTATRPPRTLAKPEAENVYLVEGCKPESGKTANCLPPCENTKRMATG